MSGTIEQRVAGIERRIAKVERHLGLAREERAYAHVAAVETVAVREAREVRAPVEVRAPIAPPPLPVVTRDLRVGETIEPARVPMEIPRVATAPLGMTPRAAATQTLGYERAEPPQPPAGEQTPWEQLIGLKLAGWVGAVVLVIGAGLGIKFAYDRGVFQGVPPGVWLSLLSLFAFALIGAGEYVYRRISHISATGLFGAGVAMLFIVSYAGHGYYELYEQTTAFALMALSTLVGAGVAMRGRLVSIGVLALIGGALAPLVLRGDQTLVVPFLFYLLMLQVVALVLSWWGATPKWWTLRAVSLSATVVWMATLLWGAAAWSVEMWFAVVFAALYQAEMVLSQARASRTPHDMRGAGTAFSVIVTAALAGALLWVLRHEPDALRGIAMVVMSAATLGMSVLVRQVRGGEGLAELGYAYRMQAAVLAIIAVPIAFSGAAVSVGWAGLALALALVGAKTQDRGARFTAAATWALACAQVILWWMSERAEAHAVWLTVLDQPLKAALIVAWGLVACGHAIAFLHTVGRTEDPTSAAEGRALSVAASALFTLATMAALPALAASAAMLIYAWVLLAGQRAAPRLETAGQAIGILALTMAKWIIFDTLAQGMMKQWTQTAGYWPIVNPMTLVGVALAGTMLLAERLLRSDARREAMRAGAICAAGLIVLWAGTMEIDRLVELGAFAGAGAWPAWQLKNLVWTAWWSAGVTAALLAARWRDVAALRHPEVVQIAASIIVLLGAKYLLFDTLAFRLLRGPAAVTVVANLQTFAGAIVFAALVLVRHMLGEGAGDDPRARQTMRSAGAMAMIMLLWAGSLEIDRAFRTAPAVMALFADPKLAEQVALSIFWSLFAITSVAAGFKIRLAALRYFGLALFAVTLLKIGVIDLKSAATGYRILSFMGLGALLLGTSVLYGKLSPRLLSHDAAEAGASGDLHE